MIEYLLDDEKTKKLVGRVGEISTLDVPEDYKRLWEDINYGVQLDKANRHGLSEADRLSCFEALIKRPYYLVNIAREFGAKNIVEVGTAQGLQFYSFAKYVSSNDGHVWSCDLRDVRNKEYAETYSDVTTFVPGTSLDLANSLPENQKIDMFYIDADHRIGAVARDVANLRRYQHDDTVWVFDDFDVRFGCYRDIMMLCKMNKRFKVYRVGDAASGNPNHQVVIFGKL
tara:strand:+ start:309 stop:992 length:684 start_codon:yes stop_codon:yes gene_type:complete